jgi:hypothetical protein
MEVISTDERYKLYRYTIHHPTWKISYAYDIMDLTTELVLSPTGKIQQFIVHDIPLGSSQKLEVGYLNKITNLLNEEDRLYQVIVYEYCKDHKN